MSGEILSKLGWLPRPPADLSAQLRSVGSTTHLVGSQLRLVTRYALDENQLAKVARVIDRRMLESAIDGGLSPIRLAVLASGTPDLVVDAIKGTGPRHGLLIDCVTAGYGQALQEVMADSSRVRAFDPSAVLIALDWRAFFPLTPFSKSSDAARDALAAGLCYLRTLTDAVRANLRALCVVQTVAPPVERVFGSLESSVAGTLHALIDQLNSEIRAQAASNGWVVLDIAGLASAVGLANWHSPMEWNLAKLPFASVILPLYADHVVRLIASTKGRSRRCLVLDLDNTLWGGVIGDDGPSGIRLGQGDPVGEAYLDFQRFVLSLRERGVVLAVSSKNTDEVARSVFREHPEMLLRESHIAVFQANWNDKATNITAIARSLSLGLESIAFVDDNPFERELVRRALPDVAVLEMPEDPALYSRVLSASGYFELASLSSEDLARADFYAGNAERAALEQSVGDLGQYLESLDMEIVFQPFDEIGLQRITQLINKSNQFNLTTRRYTEVEVAELSKAPDCYTMQVRLLDRFGDNGMICVVICRPDLLGNWVIDTWLMSCRVLGRRVEQAVLCELLRAAEAAGASELEGVFIPTLKNDLVKDHYRSLGFDQVATEADGTTRWRIPVGRAQVSMPPMRVRRIGYGSNAAEPL